MQDKKINIRKFFSIVLTLCLCVTLMIGCASNQKGKDEQIVSVEKNTNKQNDVKDTSDKNEIKEKKLLTFTIGNVEYSLGMSFEKMIENLTIDPSIASLPAAIQNSYYVIEPYCSKEIDMLDKNGNVISVTIYNDSNEKLDHKDCKVEKISFSVTNTSEFMLSATKQPLDLKSSANDFENVLGEWNSLSKGDGDFPDSYLWLWHDSLEQEQISIYLNINSTTGLIEYVKLEYDSLH